MVRRHPPDGARVSWTAGLRRSSSFRRTPTLAAHLALWPSGSRARLSGGSNSGDSYRIHICCGRDNGSEAERRGQRCSDSARTSPGKQLSSFRLLSGLSQLFPPPSRQRQPPIGLEGLVKCVTATSGGFFLRARNSPLFFLSDPPPSRCNRLDCIFQKI